MILAAVFHGGRCLILAEDLSDHILAEIENVAVSVAQDAGVFLAVELDQVINGLREGQGAALLGSAALTRDLYGDIIGIFLKVEALRQGDEQMQILRVAADAYSAVADAGVPVPLRGIAVGIRSGDIERHHAVALLRGGQVVRAVSRLIRIIHLHIPGALEPLVLP